MAQETFTKEQFWAELDKLGEEAVRSRIAVAHYDRARCGLAEEWVRRIEQSRIDASNAEHLRTAHSAKNAAWAAAIAAIIAAICAIISIVVPILK